MLTEFVGDVRKLLDEWGRRQGRRLRLSARVPSRPESALALGMDGVEWARRDYIDQLVVTPFWATVDTDVPIELWRRLLHGTGITLAAGLELLVRPYSESGLRVKNSLESIRGAATSLLSRGADRIYLFNYFDSPLQSEEMKEYSALLREIGSLETMRGKPRRHIVTYADIRAPGEPESGLLPLHCRAGIYSSLRIHIGERPTSGRVEARLGIESDGPDGKAGCGIMECPGILRVRSGYQ